MLNLTRLHLGIAHESQFQGLGITRLISSIFVETSPGGRPGIAKTARVAAGGNYGGGQLSLVSEVFVLTTWQVLSMQYSVNPSWKIVQRLKFHSDWIPGVPIEVLL